MNMKEISVYDGGKSRMLIQNQQHYTLIETLGNVNPDPLLLKMLKREKGMVSMHNL